MAAKRCNDCRFWNALPPEQQHDVDAGVTIGECLRFPPMITGDLRTIASHPAGGIADFYTGPITRDGDWCGECKA
jgi:hypothetical protein